MRTVLLVLSLLLYSTPALADTLGLLPWNAPADQESFWQVDVAPGCYVARTQTELEDLMKGVRGVPSTKPTRLLKVDFDRHMAVAIGRPADRRARIYRIELDNAAKPESLLVRIAADGALSQVPERRDFKGVMFHVVITSRSMLPVRFLEDSEIDGRMLALGEGVGSKEIATVPAPKDPAPAGKAALREQAEAAVCKTLTAEQIAAARKGLFGGAKNRRYPEPWSVIDTRREKDHWLITYDKLSFRVDVETAEVVPIKPTDLKP